MGAILQNGDFESAWSEGRSHRCLRIEENGEIQFVDEGSVFTPPGWLVWFKPTKASWQYPREGQLQEQTPDECEAGRMAMCCSPLAERMILVCCKRFQSTLEEQ
jgi:hypothetical protein